MNSPKEWLRIDEQHTSESTSPRLDLIRTCSNASHVDDRNRPWSQLLEFWDAASEKKFWNMRVTQTLWLLDFGSHVVSVLIGFSIFRTVYSAGSNAILSFLLLAWIGFSILVTVLNSSGSALYITWRSHSIVTRRVLMAFLISLVSSHLQAPDARAPTVLMRMLLSSSVTSLFMLSVGFQLKFKLHVVLQFICTIISTVHTPSYCEANFSDVKYEPVFRSIGQAIENAVHKVVWLGLSQSKGDENLHFNCWIIVCFLQWSVGFLLSTMLIYILELCSRAHYCFCSMESLQISIQKDSIEKGVTGVSIGWMLQTLLQDAVVISTWVLLVSTITVWEILKVL